MPEKKLGPEYKVALLIIFGSSSDSQICTGLEVKVEREDDSNESKWPETNGCIRFKDGRDDDAIAREFAETYAGGKLMIYPSPEEEASFAIYSGSMLPIIPTAFVYHFSKLAERGEKKKNHGSY